MIAISFARILRFGFQNFFRNVWLSVATVSVLVLTVLSVNLLIVLNVLGTVAVDTVEAKVDVAAHFRPDIEESRVQTVKVALLSMQEVRDVEYISPKEALEKFLVDNRQDRDVLESLGEVQQNPFGATLIVKAREIKDYPRILSTLAEPVYANLIEEASFDDRQVMIERLDAISAKLQLFMIGASLAFGFIALLIILNTVRVSVYTHKEEIGIMRLVGASDGFIRGPFYVEALLWTLLAVGITMAVLVPGLMLAQAPLQKFFGSGNVDIIGFYTANLWKLAGLQAFGVAFMTIVTTKMATAKYLKV